MGHVCDSLFCGLRFVMHDSRVGLVMFVGFYFVGYIVFGVYDFLCP